MSDDLDHALEVLTALVKEQEDLAAQNGGDRGHQLTAKVLAVMLDQIKGTRDFNRRNAIADGDHLSAVVHFILAAGKGDSETVADPTDGGSGNPVLLAGGCTTWGCEPVVIDLGP